ncbi:MAG: ABC transporter transmembrane domain-containing protein, partial [Ruthenibacterium sp.]
FTNNEMDKFSTASLITRTTNDITQIQQFLTMGFRMLCFAPIMGIGGVMMALNKSVSMAWIIGLGVIIILGVISVLFAVAMPRFKKMQTL